MYVTWMTDSTPLPSPPSEKSVPPFAPAADRALALKTPASTCSAGVRL
jgi:hypothetical protein